jgi:hypothetical protein
MVRTNQIENSRILGKEFMMNTLEILINEQQTVEQTIFELPEAAAGGSDLEFRFVNPVYILPSNDITTPTQRASNLEFRFVSPVYIPSTNGNTAPTGRESSFEFRFVSPVNIPAGS